MTKVTIFDHIWSTFYYGLAIVATSLLYFLLSAIGLTLANMSAQGGYSQQFISVTSSFIYTIHNAIEAPNPQDIQSIKDLNYQPYQIFITIYRMVPMVEYYWLMVVLLMGAFLPVFSKEH